jgi:MFS family permease
VNPDVTRVQRRSVVVLMASQALGGVGISAGVAVGALLAEDILGSASLAGLAQTGQVLGAALAAFLLARVMAARGRRAGLALGYGAGVVGALLCVLAGVRESFALLLLGTLAMGCASAASMQARFAATDLASADHRARALSLVVWATTLGSVLGPNLAGPGAAVARWAGVPDLTGAFLFAGASVALATACLALFLTPDPLLLARELARARGESDHAQVSLGRVAGVLRARPRAAAALATIGVGHAVMVAVMVMTPLHLRHGGAGLEIIGLVISVHVLGMVAFAPVVGWLADRIGRAAVLALGSVTLLAAVALAGQAPAGNSFGLTAGLLLLGLGWSFCMLGGSALLVDAVPLAERPGVQGVSDLLAGLFAAGAGALAGVVVAEWGYAVLNLGAGVLALVVLGAAVVAREAI